MHIYQTIRQHTYKHAIATLTSFQSAIVKAQQMAESLYDFQTALWLITANPGYSLDYMNTGK